jgi:predicted peptidase
MKRFSFFLIAVVILIVPHRFTTAQEGGDAQLLKRTYTSTVSGSERYYFVYLPKGYGQDTTQTWPVLVWLHGDGERGETLTDLDYLLKNGPLYEAWIQKRDLPFIIVAPQLPLFGRDVTGPDYLVNRTRAEIPQRLAEGVPPHNADAPALAIVGPMLGAAAAEEVPELGGDVAGTTWDVVDPDVITVLDAVLSNYQVDKSRVYMTGVSLGGFGTWYYASKYPDYFAAILPVVGYGSVAQAEAIATTAIPVWAFSGGRDPVVLTQYFFAAMNKLEEMGDEMRYTTEQDMFHDVWNRVYARDDIYEWLLSHTKG